MTDDLLARIEVALGRLAPIAAALDRLAPPPPPTADPLAEPAYLWRDGALVAARAFEPLALELLVGIDAQRAALLANMHRLAERLPAHDVLLWGARGTGKSALVKACVGAVQDGGGGLALIEAAGDALDTLPRLFAQIAGQPRAYVVFVDDLGFDTGAGGGGPAPRRLRSLLEGGAEARPANARLVVTANRRHIVPRDMAEQESAISAGDVADDKLALADRFGLSLGFHVVDQPHYVAMVEGYAAAYGLMADPAEAIAWATGRGARSGRVAWQYIVELAGRQGRRIEGDDG